jgi:hypothetical protein
MENGTVIVEEDNLSKLRKLVHDLDESDSKNYVGKLKVIESLIKEELSLISKLKKVHNKLEHYEGICAGILTIISSTELHG